jgi:mRNA interferase MazF
MEEPKLPVHIPIEDENCLLVSEATIKLEIIHTIDKKRLREKLCRLNDEMMAKVNVALKVIFGLNDSNET